MAQAPSPIPSNLLVPAPPFSDDELLEALEALLVEATAATGPPPEPVDEDTAEQPESGAEKARRWEITGRRSAEWAMSKLGEETAKSEAIAADAAEWRAIIYASVAEHLQRIDEWEANARRPHDRRADFFRGHLEQWGLDQRTAYEKSFDLPSGRVQTTATSDAFEVPSESETERMAAAVAFARERGLPVRERVGVKALKPAVAIVDFAVEVLHEGTHVWEWLRPGTFVVESDTENSESGGWRVIDTENGVEPAAARVHEGPVAVDTETGAVLEFLTIRHGEIRVKVELA